MTHKSINTLVENVSILFGYISNYEKIDKSRTWIKSEFIFIAFLFWDIKKL